MDVPPKRRVERRYRDPLDEIWIETAKRIGLVIRRSDDAFASTDGRGGISIATAAQLDADDSLAQMVFHELCHSLVQGHESFELPDWGLENQDGRDVEREHACLRVQAHIAARYGLRELLAPTTDFRAFFDKLDADPLLPIEISSVHLAKLAITRSSQAPWCPHLQTALEATAQIASAAAHHASPQSLFDAYREPQARHSTGLFATQLPDRHCGACSWRNAAGECVVSEKSVASDEVACDGFERSIACETCGACCREGYDSVTVDVTDPVTALHPQLIANRGEYLELLRDGPRCIALRGDPGDFKCAIYDDRPQCCRDLERGGSHCLTARRRVGLSI